MLTVAWAGENKRVEQRAQVGDLSFEDGSFGRCRFDVVDTLQSRRELSQLPQEVVVVTYRLLIDDLTRHAARLRAVALDLPSAASSAKAEQGRQP